MARITTNFRRFTRNKYRVSNIDELRQADFNDMRSLSQYNDGYKYILCVIDVFSKHAWAFPLYTKQGREIVDAFSKIFDNNREPLHLQTDKGTEFTATIVQKYLNENNVKYYVTKNPDIKANPAEFMLLSMSARSP
ncbi:hypothetical protein CBL_10534 [Carabus blaptoides fortunei]